MDLFLTNTQFLSSQDINCWTGVVWITCGLLWCFYQLFGLSFWRHPFTAEDPLVSKWWNATFLQISLCFYTFICRLNQELLVENNTTLCNRTVPATHLVGDSSSSVEFFVAVAVLAFLYSMVALLVYLGYMHVYRDSDFGPMFVSMQLEDELKVFMQYAFEYHDADAFKGKFCF